MNQKNKLGVVLVAGFALGLVTTTLMALPAINRAHDESLELQAQLRNQADATALCQAQQKEITGSYTVLYDGATQPSGADQPASLVAQFGSMKFFAGQGKPHGPRWWIPYKVEPIVYGPPAGTAFLWIDKKTKKVTGLLTPLVQP
jgi:hypothetical protein